MELAKVRSKVNSAELTFNDEVLKFTYRPSVTTPEFFDSLMLSGDESEHDKVVLLVEMVAAAVSSWDLTNDGKPMEVSKETCRKLPIALLNEIITKCNEDLSPTGKSAKPSQRSATGSAGGKSSGAREARENQITFVPST